MYLLVVTHRVEDYDRFKAVFDAHPPERGGAVSHSVNRAVDDPNLITIISAFRSAQEAAAWRDDPELRAAVGEAGVVGAPTVGVFEQVEVSGG